MPEITDILKKWENSDKERELFDAYCKARSEFLVGLKKQVTWKLSTDELKALYEAERQAFISYSTHREGLSRK